MKYPTPLMLALALIALVGVGCSTREVLTGVGAAGAGAAGAGWARGDLTTDVSHPIDRVHQATIATLQARGYTVEHDPGETRTRVRGEGGDRDRDVTVNLERSGDNVTQVAVRVGIWGDQALSYEIMRDIENRLGTAPAN